MRMKIFNLVLVLFLIHRLSNAQENIEFSKDNFPDKKDELKEAKNALEDGNAIFNQDVNYMFSKAIPLFKKANDFNPNNAECNYKLGVCYLYSTTKQEAIKYLEKAYLIDNKVSDDVSFYVGRGYHLAGEWDKAIKNYKDYKVVATLRGEEPERIDEIEKLIDECRNGKEISAKEERIWLDNLGPKINSATPEYSPMVSTDESFLIITARRATTIGELIDEYDDKYFEDLYYSKYNAEKEEWGDLVNFGEGVNTKGHDATSGLSPDGKTLFVYRGSQKGGGDIFASRLEDQKWTLPKKLNDNINTDFQETSASVSSDGKKLYFVSEKPGGQGGSDIYVSDWDANKKDWGVAKNLGPIVNSAYDEDGVFIHPDGSTIYFASKGHQTTGGSDIFYSEFKDGRWNEPKNLGYPINTPDDDRYFVMAADGKTAYYSSFRKEGLGENDIYRITFIGPEKQPILNTDELLLASASSVSAEKVIEAKVETRSSKMALLKGFILDYKTKLPVTADVEIVDNKTGIVVNEFKADQADGGYLVSLPSGRDYGIIVKSAGYLFHSENINLPDSATYKQYRKDIYLQKVEIGSKVVLRNIFFDYDRFTLRKESETELERLADLLKNNPDLKVEISGHTDDKGADEYNQKLSENRAKAVVEDLKKRGIAIDRLTFVGFGETQPIATNTTDNGRQENRRTEFKITGQ
jgi:outer membrane protein OmpA-like peptidoglycan-associated protein/Tol biopolymer transport system component